MIILTALVVSYTAAAHEGEDHSKPPGTEAAAAPGVKITLTDTAIKNLGIQTFTATLAPRAATVDLNGTTEFLAERQAIVAAPSAGRVATIAAKVGEQVKKGQTLLTVQPVFVGSSPVAIAAAIGGFVTKQNIVPGQSVTPETTLMEIGDATQLLVRGVMYDSPDMARIKAGQTVRVASRQLGGSPFTGVIQRLDSAFDRGNRTFNVYALIENPGLQLLANMFVVVSVEIAAPADVLTVPAKAILGESGDLFVYVRDGNSFERRSVKLGARFGTDREILEGVFPDEDVVIVGNYQLQFARSAEPKKPELKK
jgi:cobalt-zinc-cadmium efflux system membrane fusion protein